MHGLGLGSKTNSMWLNGVPLPEAASSLQTKLSIGMQLEMQRLQVWAPKRHLLILICPDTGRLT